MKSPPVMDLDWALSPMTSDEFFTNYWERDPLHITGRGADYYKPLFSLTDVDPLLSHGVYLDHEVMMVGKGRQQSGYVDDKGMIDVKKITTSYDREDMSLKLSNPEIRHQELGRCCRELEREFRTSTSVALFMTPPHAVGVPVHFDTMDVLVQQIDGEKVWRIYRPLEEMKLPSELGDRRAIDPEKLGEPLLDVTLKAGDLLYVPRGFPHEPFTRDIFSLHISIGVKPVIWADVLKAMIERKRSTDMAFRRSIPRSMSNGGGVLDEMKDYLDVLLNRFSSEFELEKAVGDVKRDVLISMRPAEEERLRPLVLHDDLSEESLIKKTAGLIVQVDEVSGKAVISFQGSSISGPLAIMPALRYIASHDRFTVASIHQNLSTRSKLALVKKLMKAGLLTTVDDAVRAAI